MKKFIIIGSVLLLIGVGCSKQQTPNAENKSSGEIIDESQKMAATKSLKNISEEELREIKKIFQEKINAIGFVAYSPNYLPDSSEVYKASIIATDLKTAGKILTFRIRETNATNSKIIEIREQKYIEGLGGEITNPNEIKIPDLNGYYLIEQVDMDEVNTVSFVTPNNISIKISSKDYVVDELIKIAKSFEQ
ncbi:MAG: hypothetical protein Q8O88_05390 [bacterium]|nr:hypothetical protein [bacterium]